MNFRRLTLSTIVAVALLSGLAHAGGFQINEHAARATGMAGAFAAQSSDPSAIFFNPAGLAFLKGKTLSLGTTLIFPSTTFSGPTPSTQESKMNSQVFYPSNLYGTYAMNDDLVFGLGVYNPFGLGTEWPSNWVGRYLAVKADIVTFFINPTVAYKISDQLSVGVGVSYVYSSVSLSYNIATFTDQTRSTISSQDGSVLLDATGSGINFDAGLLYKPMRDLSIGVSYRHSTKIDFSGTATFSNMQGLAQYFPGGTGKTTITMPNSIYGGIAYNFTPELLVEADVQWVAWSTYDKLKVDLADGPPDPQSGNKPLQTSQPAQVKDWADASLIRVGVQYSIDDQLTVRGGYIFDSTPQPDKTAEPILPDADRNDFALGFTYKLSKDLAVDVAYLLVLFSDRTIPASVNNFPGTYKSSANLFGLNLTYTLE
ncbi:MAG: outer membrane protein transport protein [Bacteroidota bacterium]